MQFQGPSWWWSLLLVAAVVLAVLQIRVLQGKIEEPGWPLIDAETRSGQVAVVCVFGAFAAFFLFGLLGSILQ